MPIPKELLAVERPKNTVVIAYGKNKDRFAVRQRVGCRNIDGRHLPVNGPTIGHIIDDRYVPIIKETTAPVSQARIDMKDWADIILCDNVFRRMLPELQKVYCQADAQKLYCRSESTYIRVAKAGD